jgi:hypothetical protein
MSPQPENIGLGVNPAMQKLPAEDSDMSNTTPEEQAQYELVVKNARQIIYGQRTQDNPVPVILAMLAGDAPPEIASVFEGAEPPLSDNPVDNLASAACFTALMVDASAQEAGMQLPDDVLFHAFFEEIVPQLVQDAEEAGLHEFAQEEIDGAFYRGLDLFRTTSPRVDEDNLRAEFDQIVAADKQGGIDQILPGMQQQ